MPDIQITGSADEIETRDDLILLWTQLLDLGWVGTIGASSETPATDSPIVVQVNMMAADPSSPGGQKTLNAKIGDMKITIGTSVTAMTLDAYTAAYGAS